MMIDNVILNMDDHILIEVILWLCLRKPNKQTNSNNHKHKFITQHLNSITYCKTYMSTENKLNHDL